MSSNKINSDTKEKSFLIYKGKPLVRCGDTIYYGDIKNKFVIEMTIKSASELHDLRISEKISVRLVDTNPCIVADKKIIKISEKNGLYNALDIGCIWLERALDSTTSA